MKRILSWAWNLVPEPARIYVIITAIVALIAGTGFVIHKIYSLGYDQCDSDYKAAAAEAKDKARPPIIDTGKAHDKVKAEVARDPGSNDPAGPRVSHALDSLRGKMGNR